MDTQTAPARNTDVVPGAVEGAEEEHQKIPMFTKMRNKVKKIKNTINKKVHDQGGHQEHGDLDEGHEDDEDDEEMVESEVHGAPTYDKSAPPRETTTQNRPNAVGRSDESLDVRAREGAAQNRPNAVGGFDERSDARARPVETAKNQPNAVGSTDESSYARARVGTAHDRPNAVGGPDESSEAHARVGTAQDRPISVGGPDESSDEHARVGTAQDRPFAVRGPDESSDARARVGTAHDRPNSVGGPDDSSNGRSRVGTAQDRPNPIGGHEGNGTVGSGLITAEPAEDPAPPKTSSTEAATAKEQDRAGEEFEVPPELHRSFKAMTVSNQTQDQPEDMEEDKLSKDKNSSYTEKFSSAKDAAVSAASMVYEKVAVAGTAVMAKVKPEAGKDSGEHENLGKTQDKGVSMKDYLAEKLTPGEDDKALSAKITEAVQGKKDAAPVTPPPREVNGSGEAGGMGVVGKMRETVTSYLGGGGSSPKSAPGTESPAKVAEITEAVQKEDAAPVTTSPREVTGADEAGGGVGVVGKIRGTVSSFLGGGGSSPKSPPASESPTKAAATTEAVQKKDAAPVTTSPREVTGTDEAGGGMGVVGKIRGTVSSFLGGGGSSPKSAPVTESPTKVAEDTKNLHSRPTEAISEEKNLE